MANLAFGNLVFDMISVTGEEDAYTFTGTVGDRVFLSMASSNITSEIRLYRPDGTLLTSGESGWSSEVDLLAFLDTTGTYTVIVGDGETNGAQTGSYGFSAQRTNNPGNATALSFGTPVLGTLGLPGEKDTYTFTGTPGDKVSLNMAGFNLTPEIKLYRPNGTLLNSWALGSYPEANPQAFLDSAGTYTVVVGDANVTGTGSYGISVQRTNNPGNATALSFGTPVLGVLGLTGEEDTYTFSGTLGDKISLNMAGQNINSEIKLYRPNGTLLNSWALGSYPEVNPLAFLDSTGTYTVVVGDANGTGTGSYGISVQRTNNPGNATALSFGTLVSGIINGVAEEDSYTFSGALGDKISLSMASQNLYSEIKVYRPDGTLLTSGESSPNSEVELEAFADSAGTYTVVVGDAQGTQTGTYGLSVQRTNNPGNATNLSFGTTLSGTVSLVGEEDSYTFSGALGDKISLSVSSNDFYSEIKVYRPDGTLLTSGQSDWSSEVNLLAFLDSTGTYTVVVGDQSGTQTGTYGLSVQRTMRGTPGADNLVGSSGKEQIYGYAGNDTLNGGAGNDTLFGGTDSDTYVVDSADDVVTEAANEGTDTVQTTVTSTLGANVENLTLTGTAAINGTGNTLNNSLTGNTA